MSTVEVIEWAQFHQRTAIFQKTVFNELRKLFKGYRKSELLDLVVTYWWQTRKDDKHIIWALRCPKTVKAMMKKIKKHETDIEKIMRE